jgi:hypothetical protein
MLSLLLALCCGLVNAGRGSGIKGGKVYTVLAMLIACYIITNDPIRTIIFPLPLCALWWQKYGTGKDMPEIVRKLAFLNFKDKTWRFVEFISVFVYSWGYLSL